MPKPFDATLKELIEAFPDDWLRRLGVPAAGPVEVLSPELSTVTAAADTLLRVGDVVVHIDSESGPDADLPTKMLLYNVLAHRETGLPVHSAAVLLRPNANPGGLQDTIRYSVHPSGELHFRFEIIRIWESSPEEIMRSGLGLLPLAVLGKPPKGMTRRQMIPDVLEAVAQRAIQTAPRERLDMIVAAAVILGGMYLPPDEMRKAIQRLPAMIESSAFEVLEEFGAIKQAKKTILIMGEQKFGEPTDEQKQRLEAIDDLPRLNRIIARLLKVDDWDALLKGR